MKNIFFIAVIAVLALFLSSCKDVIDKPLVMSDAHIDLSSVTGKWVTVSESEELNMVISRKEDDGWFELQLKYDSSIVNSIVNISQFNEYYIINIDLSSISYDGFWIFKGLDSRYVILGAYFDGGKLVMLPADMDVFLNKFNSHYVIKSEKLLDNCASIEIEGSLKANLCRSFLSGVNVISLNPYDDFYEDFTRSFSQIFPLDGAFLLNRQ
jgi:hypothetical protein